MDSPNRDFRDWELYDSKLRRWFVLERIQTDPRFTSLCSTITTLFSNPLMLYIQWSEAECDCNCHDMLRPVGVELDVKELIDVGIKIVKRDIAVNTLLYRKGFLIASKIVMLYYKEHNEIKIMVFDSKTREVSFAIPRKVEKFPQNQSISTLIQNKRSSPSSEHMDKALRMFLETENIMSAIKKQGIRVTTLG